MPSPRPPRSRVFLFNLPVTWQTPVAERIFCDELRRLGRFLIGLGGHAPATGDLVEIMSAIQPGAAPLAGRGPLVSGTGVCRGRGAIPPGWFGPPAAGAGCPSRSRLDSTTRYALRVRVLSSGCGLATAALRAQVPSRSPWSGAPCRNHKCRCWMPSKRRADAWF